MKRVKFLPPHGKSKKLPYNPSWRTTIGGYDPADNNDIRGITNEFLCSTSIHGMKYLGERGRSICERIFWLLLVSAGCVLSVYACYLEWYKWNDSSILITRDPTVVTHDPLKFPIVTVCSANKISKRKLEEIIQDPKYNWMNFTEMTRMISYLTEFDSFVNPDDDFPRFLHALTEHNITVEDVIKIVHQVAPTCNDTFVDCQWKSKVVDCGKLFSPLLTDDGFCCSSDIDILDTDPFLRSSDSPSSTVYEYGIHSALRIILDPSPSDAAGNAVAFNGFKVLLHNKGEFPDVSERGFIIGTGHENFVALNLNSVAYTSDIASISLEKRRCYVDGEKKLKYIKGLNYSRSSCLYECRLESIIKECYCLPYFIQANIPGVPSCSFQDYQCVARFYDEKLAALSRFCNCPATCKDHWYTTEISSVPFSPAGFPMTKSFRRVSKMRKIDAKDSVRLIGLRIFFKYNAGDSFKMDVPFGNKELLASMGGLLGFGLGFSAISAVELCYFLCCRWCFRRKKKQVSTANYNWATRHRVVFPHPKLLVSPINNNVGILTVSTISK